MRFADSVRKPGQSTRLIITAAPGSLVAVAAVDKSVQEENELTLDDVRFGFMSTMWMTCVGIQVLCCVVVM